MISIYANNYTIDKSIVNNKLLVYLDCDREDYGDFVLNNIDMLEPDDKEKLFNALKKDGY